MFIQELGYEVKDIKGEFKDIDTKKGIIVGYFAVFGNKDSDGDIIEPGAFAKSIKERGPDSKKPRIKHLMDHNRYKSVARILSLEEDSHGLRHESFAGRHTDGRDFLLMCEDGLITEQSIGFETMKDNRIGDTNFMKELLLWEGSSLQSWGANMETSIDAVKAKGVKDLVNEFEKLQKAIRDGKYSDQTFIRLEAQLKEINARLKSLTETSQPDLSTDPNGAIDILKQFNHSLTVSI